MTWSSWVDGELDAIRGADRWRSFRSFDALGPVGELPQVSKIGGMAVGLFAVGSAGQLQLQHAQFDAQLEDVAAVVGLETARLNHTGFVLPTLQGGVNVLAHGLPPALCPGMPLSSYRRTGPKGNQLWSGSAETV